MYWLNLYLNWLNKCCWLYKWEEERWQPFLRLHFAPLQAVEDNKPARDTDRQYGQNPCNVDARERKRIFLFPPTCAWIFVCKISVLGKYYYLQFKYPIMAGNSYPDVSKLWLATISMQRPHLCVYGKSHSILYCGKIEIGCNCICIAIHKCSYLLVLL